MVHTRVGSNDNNRVQHVRAPCRGSCLVILSCMPFRPCPSSPTREGLHRARETANRKVGMSRRPCFTGRSRRLLKQTRQPSVCKRCASEEEHRYCAFPEKESSAEFGAKNVEEEMRAPAVTVGCPDPRTATKRRKARRKMSNGGRSRIADRGSQTRVRRRPTSKQTRVKRKGHENRELEGGSLMFYFRLLFSWCGLV